MKLAIGWMARLAAILALALSAVPGALAAAAAGEARVALVIGNAAYQQGELANPVNDARAVAGRLRDLGFDVLLRENVRVRAIGGIYREFRSRIVPGGVALVFYAGHGAQVKGQNYFPAVDSEIVGEEDVPLQSLNLSTLLDNMEEARAGVSLVFLDACRDNPFARRFRSASRGLAKSDAASGTLIHYATRPGSIASDGDGNNGTYTEALLAELGDAEGIPVEQVLKRITNRVVAKSRGRQEPWVEGSLRGDFYFSAAVTKSTVAETEAWSRVRGSSREDAFWDFLAVYPNGHYALMARAGIEALRQSAGHGAQVSGGQPATVPVGDSTGRTGPPKIPQAPPVLAPPPAAEMPAGKAFRDCPDCPEMIALPAGSFLMGSVQGDNDEKPVHPVRIGKPFAMSRTEVTQGQWQAIMGNNPSYFQACGETCPVEQVSWDEVQEFLKQLAAKTGATYRLPSEAEWEYACRAGSDSTYCGGEEVDALAWSSQNVNGGGTQPVAGRRPNAWGLHDMSGNVWEWTADCWNASYNGAPSDGGDWTKGNCSKRVLRGGSIKNRRGVLRTTNRTYDSVDDHDRDDGFRVVRVLP